MRCALARTSAPRSGPGFLVGCLSPSVATVPAATSTPTNATPTSASFTRTDMRVLRLGCEVESASDVVDRVSQLLRRLRLQRVSVVLVHQAVTEPVVALNVPA